MTDRTTKLLLAAIALGLWMNILGDWIRPVQVQAQSDVYLQRIANAVQSIESDLGEISYGSCINGTIC